MAAIAIGFYSWIEHRGQSLTCLTAYNRKAHKYRVHGIEYLGFSSRAIFPVTTSSCLVPPPLAKPQAHREHTTGYRTPEPLVQDERHDTGNGPKV